MKKYVILWLDDKRDPFEREWNDYIKGIVPSNGLNYNIAWVKDRNEFFKYLRENGLPDFISWDSDLAEEHYTPEEYWDDYDRSKAYQESQNYIHPIGVVVALEFIQYCRYYMRQIPDYHIHSENPVGADNIRTILETGKRLIFLDVE